MRNEQNHLSNLPLQSRFRYCLKEDAFIDTETNKLFKKVFVISTYEQGKFISLIIMRKNRWWILIYFESEKDRM